MSTLRTGLISLFRFLLIILLPALSFAEENHIPVADETAESLPLWLVACGICIAVVIAIIITSKLCKKQNDELVEMVKVRSHELEERVVAHKKLIHDFDELQKKYEEQATHDELTGAQNRHGFDETFGVVQGIVDRYARPFSILLFEVDHFRAINKTHGAAVGDKVLKAITAAVVDLLRTSDSVYRFADKEFMVILPETPIDHAFIAAERVRMTVSKVFVPPVTDHTLSIGVAEIQEHEDFEKLSERVSEAMKKARESGGNTIFRAKYE